MIGFEVTPSCGPVVTLAIDQVKAGFLLTGAVGGLVHTCWAYPYLLSVEIGPIPRIDTLGRC